MSIKICDNDIRKLGGQIIFIPENCEYLNGKSLELVGCVVYCFKDQMESQIIKTIYGVFLSGGMLKVCGDSVCLNNSSVYCSGNLENFGKNLAAYCRKICGKEDLRIG